MSVLGHQLRIDLEGLESDAEALRRVAEVSRTLLPDALELPGDAGSFVQDVETFRRALERVGRQVDDEVAAIVTSLHRRLLEVRQATAPESSVAPTARPGIGPSSPDVESHARRSPSNGRPRSAEEWGGPSLRTLLYEVPDDHDSMYRTLPHEAPGDAAIERNFAMEHWDLLADVAVRQSIPTHSSALTFGAPVGVQYPTLAACVPTSDADRRRRRTWGW